MKPVGEELDIAVRSHRLHGQRFGSPSAPLVLGLHGLSLNMKAFDFVGERLGGDALQLVALDLRGRGNSDTTPPGTYGWERFAPTPAMSCPPTTVTASFERSPAAPWSRSTRTISRSTRTPTRPQR
jgi:pimeloyl-ACP methyl ester carboxylesterase